MKRAYTTILILLILCMNINSIAAVNSTVKDKNKTFEVVLDDSWYFENYPQKTENETPLIDAEIAINHVYFEKSTKINDYVYTALNDKIDESNVNRWEKQAQANLGKWYQTSHGILSKFIKNKVPTIFTNTLNAILKSAPNTNIDLNNPSKKKLEKENEDLKIYIKNLEGIIQFQNNTKTSISGLQDNIVDIKEEQTNMQTSIAETKGKLSELKDWLIGIFKSIFPTKTDKKTA
jgi:hypothetical protein